ncbi:MAG: DUF1573 domain-containing protein [Pirellulaceae bacterium]|nr:DUF1573 domain-containing protein [Pirellulaceae bacterium]
MDRVWIAEVLSAFGKNTCYCCMVLLIASSYALSQEAVENSAETPLTDKTTKADLLVLGASTEISQQTFRNIMIPCGTVDQGQNVKVLLTVKNSMEEPFYFDAAVPSCTCTYFDTPAKSINPGEAIVMEFRFKSNLDPIAREQRASVKFIRNTQEVGYLIPSCKIRFGMSFEAGNHSILLGGQLSEYRIPFFYSDPIKLEELEVSIASGFEKTDLSFLVKPVAEGYGYVAVLTKDVGNDRGFDSGILRLEHKPSGRYAETSVLASRKSEIEFVPDNLYFSRINDGANAGLYAASALVRVNSIATVQGSAEGGGVQSSPPSLVRDEGYIAEKEVDEEEKEAERLRIQEEEAKDPELAKRRQAARERISVSGLFDGQNEPSVEVKQIGKTVVRVRVIAQRNQLDENKSIQWTVIRDGVSHKIVSSFSIVE